MRWCVLLLTLAACGRVVEVRLDSRVEASPPFSRLEVDAFTPSGEPFFGETSSDEDFFPVRFEVVLSDADRKDSVSLVVRGLDQDKVTFTARLEGRLGDQLFAFIDFCGDGFTAPLAGEECDDGPSNSDSTPGACRLSCTLPACGDGVLDAGEECDDGNQTDGDGCDSTCLPTGCSSGVVTAGEVCFAENDDLRGPPNPAQILAGDLNGDSVPDLAAPYPLDGVVRVYPGDGAGLFGSLVEIPLPGVSRLASGDLDGDGSLDLVALSGSSASLLLADGAGGFSVVPGPSALGVDVRALALADLDQDGALDLLTLDRAQGALSVRPGSGSGSFGGVDPNGQILPVGALPTAFAVADLDGDTDLDVVVVRSSGLGLVLLNSGGVLAPSPTALPSIGGAPSALVVADLDGLDSLDLAVSKQENGRGFLRVFAGKGAGKFQFLADFDAPDSPSALVAADLDLDGDFDLASTGEADSLVAVQFNNSAAQFDAPRDASGGLFETRRAPVSLAAADLNGDSVPDLIAAGENLGLLLSNP
jgi:cysteine-rich repeat protein